MKLTRGLVGIILSFSLAFISFLALPQRPVVAQEVNAALQRGYRTGYSDGYMSGYRDILDSAVRSYSAHGEYADASRAYSKDYGLLEDYRDGYQQGFVSGYNTGYDKKTFDAVIPLQLSKQGVVAPIAESNPDVQSQAAAPSPAQSQAEAPPPAQTQPQTDAAATQPVSYKSSDAMIVIPSDTELIIELQDELGTVRSKAGDKFTATVVSPVEIQGATIEGRVDKIQKPGRITRRSEMSLSFDRIVLSENRWSNFNAVLTEVLPVKGDNVRRVDNEGTAVGKSSVKSDTITVGGATGTGLVVGAIAGGPVGAAVGAGVGAAFGVGAVVIARGKNIDLAKNQQLRIKTAYETKIR